MQENDAINIERMYNLTTLLICYPVAGEVKESFLHLLPRKRLLLIVYVLAFSWFVNGASYYGLTLAAGHIGNDILA